MRYWDLPNEVTINDEFTVPVLVSYSYLYLLSVYIEAVVGVEAEYDSIM